MRTQTILALTITTMMIGSAFAAEVTGTIGTNNINQGLNMNLPCNPSTVSNGTVNPYTCAITCTNGYSLSGNSCYVPSSGGGGG